MKYIVKDFQEEKNVTFSREDKEMYDSLLAQGFFISEETATGYKFRKSGKCLICELTNDNILNRTCKPDKFIKHFYQCDVVKRYHVDKLLLELNNGNISFDDILNFRT